MPIRLQRGLLELAEGLVRRQEGILLQDCGQGLPFDSPPWPDDIVAVRLQCWVPWVLPLPDQAVVREQARLVLPAHGPWLPDHAPALMRRDEMLTSEQLWRTYRWREQAVLG